MFNVLVFAFLAGCTGGGKGGVGVDDISVSDCLSEGRPSKPSGAPEADTAAPDSVLTATAAGGGSVTVVHEYVSAECCVGFDVSADADTATNTVTVSYEETGDPCDCMCVYNLNYTLTGLTAGDWTINADGDTTTVTVE